MAVSAIQTYSDLQTTVADYLMRTDVTTQIQIAVSLAEAEFNRSIRNKRMENRVKTPTIAGVAYYGLPSDFLEMRAMTLDQNPRVLLQFLAPQQIETLYADQTAQQPEAYSIVDSEFRLAPMPDGVYSVEILYYQTIPSLATATTNWLLTYHSDLYLWGTLLQMAILLRDADLGGAITGMYQASMASLHTESTSDHWNGAPLVPIASGWTP